MRLCPRCRQRFTVARGNDDFVHECNSGQASIDQEDVVKLGDWEDYSGSGTVQNAQLQGLVNTLTGTDAGIEGVDDEPVTARGARSSTHRARQHEEFINLKD